LREPSTIALALSMIVRALVVLNPIALNARRISWHRASVVNGESVEQMDTDGKRQLLARDGVDERFEDGGEPWGLDAP